MKLERTPVVKRYVIRGSAAPVAEEPHYSAPDPTGYPLTLTHTGRDGQPNTDHWTTVRQLGTEQTWLVDATAPVSSVTLPAGRYTVRSYMPDANGDASLLVVPELVLDGAGTVDLDARQAQPISVALPDATAAPRLAEVSVFTRLTPDLRVIDMMTGASFEHMYLGRIGPDAATSSSVVHGEWILPNGTEGYNLAWAVDGHVDTGLTRTVTPDQIATVHATYASHVDGVPSSASALAHFPGNLQSVYGLGYELWAPQTLTTHYNTDGGVRWAGSFIEGAGSPAAGSGSNTGPPIGYAAGQEYAETWNRGVFGPANGTVTRADNMMTAWLGTYSDGAGRRGTSDLGTRQLTLHRNGVPVKGTETGDGTFLFENLPASSGTYRLQLDAERGEPATLSTRINAAWTFASAATNAATPLPLWLVRLDPDLDKRNTAPAGQPFAVPVAVTPQPGSTTGTLTTLTVDVSYDDGQAWQPAEVRDGSARLSHPDGTGYVSLRVNAADSAGNTVTETVIHAYRYAPLA